MVWWSVVWCGVVWCVVWCGVVWCGVVWCGVVLCGMLVNLALFGVAGCGLWGSCKDPLVIPRYLQLAIHYDYPFNIAKYCLQQLLGSGQDSDSGRVFLACSTLQVGQARLCRLCLTCQRRVYYVSTCLLGSLLGSL